MIRRMVCALAIATTACGNDPAPDDAAPAASEQADPPAPAPAAEPTPAPPRTEGVVTIEPGKKAPAEIRWLPPVGSTQRLVVSVRVNRRLGDDPSPLEPRLGFELDTTVASSSGGKWRREFTIATATVLPEDKVDPATRSALEPFVASLVGKTGYLSIGVDGRVEAYELDAEGGDPQQTALLGALSLALRSHVVPAPSDAVGDGGAWEVTRRDDVLGVESWRVDRVGLRRRYGEQLELRADITFGDGDVTGDIVGFSGLGPVTALTGKGELDGRFDVHRASPVEMHLGVSFEFDATRDGGDAVHGKVGVDITVDEDFISLRDPRVVLRGEFTQGGLIQGKVVPGTKVWFRGKRVKVADTGDFLFGFGRDAKRRATLGFSFSGAPAERHVVHISPREYEPERIDGLPPEMVDLDPAARKELARSRKEVGKVRNKATNEAYFVDGWVMPVKGKITSTYGRQRILNGEDHGFHWGVDISTPVGKKVHAPAPGVVVLAENDVPLSGNLVIIDHGHGLTSSFLHLHKILVEVGDEVSKGQTIAEAGKTGRVTGPHLDWRMNLFDTRIDPMLVMKL